MTLPKLQIAVLMGGWSSERPVSLMSGNGVADALEHAEVQGQHGGDEGEKRDPGPERHGVDYREKG